MAARRRQLEGLRRRRAVMGSRALTPKARAIWSALLMRLVAVAEADPAQATYVSEIIAGVEAKAKLKELRRQRLCPLKGGRA